MHRVSKAEQIFSKVSAVLTSNSGEQRNASFRILSSHVHSSEPASIRSSVAACSRSKRLQIKKGVGSAHGRSSVARTATTVDCHGGNGPQDCLPEQRDDLTHQLAF